MTAPDGPPPRRRDLRTAAGPHRRRHRTAHRTAHRALLAATVLASITLAGFAVAQLRGLDLGSVRTELVRAGAVSGPVPAVGTAGPATASAPPGSGPGSGPGQVSPPPDGSARMTPSPPAPSPSTARSRPAPRSAVSTSRPAAGVHAPAQVLHDVAYATGSPAQVLDLHLPERTGTAVPLVVYVHGGGFFAGDKSDDLPPVGALADHGYAVANVNYRLSGEERFPAGVADVKAAVRWLRAAAPRYGVDPGRFGAWGDSAGGYLVTMLGVTGDQHTLFDDASLGHAGTSSAVQAVVDWFGPTDFRLMDSQLAAAGCDQAAQVHDAGDSPESRWLGVPITSAAATALLRSANPITWTATARHLPPFLVTHGSADCTVPPAQSGLLVAALRARHASVTHTVPAGAGHEDPVITHGQLPAALAFLDRTLGAP